MISSAVSQDVDGNDAILEFANAGVERLVIGGAQSDYPGLEGLREPGGEREPSEIGQVGNHDITGAGLL